MFNVQTLAQKIRNVQPDIQSVDSFEDWFVAASWGHYDVDGDSLSNAIAAVSHVLYSYRADELDEAHVPGELATAIRPFVASPLVVNFVPVSFARPHDALPEVPKRFQWRQPNANESVPAELILTVGASNSTQPPPQRKRASSFVPVPMREIRAVA